MIRGVRGAVIGAAFVCAFAHADSPLSLEEMIAAADASWHAQNETALLATRQGLAELAAGRPGERLPGYYLALIDYRLATINSGGLASGTLSWLESCEAGLKEQLATDEEFGEGWLLLAACRWERLTGADLGALPLVPQALSAQSRGIRLVEESPRAPLVDAIGLMRRPASLGGNSANAERALEEGLRRFSASYLDPEGIDWGQEDLWLRLGDLYRSRADTLRARDAYEQVLLVIPESSLARKRLESLQGEIESPGASDPP